MAKSPATTRAGPNRAGLRRTPPPAAVAAVAQPPAEKAGAEPEPQARTQPPEQPRAEEPRPVAVAKAVTAVAEAAVTAVAAPVAAPAAVVAVPVAAVPARVEVVDVVDPVIQDSTVVDTDPVPGVHPVGDDVLIRNAEVMRHLGSVKAAVAPETSRPGVHARIPPRITPPGDPGLICPPCPDLDRGRSPGPEASGPRDAPARRRRAALRSVRAERPGSLEGSAPARSFRSGARCGLLPRRRVCRRRQEECAGVAGGPLPGGGDLGGLGQLPALNRGAVSSPDARRCPRYPVPQA